MAVKAVYTSEPRRMIMSLFMGFCEHMETIAQAILTASKIWPWSGGVVLLR